MQGRQGLIAAEPSPEETRAGALAAATRRLAEAGLPDPARDAGLLLCAAAGLERSDLLRHPQVRMDSAAHTRFAGLIARRLAREPVSRILGRRGFWTFDLAITPAVLDPRPETETLVTAVLAWIGERRSKGLRILDLGTGSGAILCALLSECPEAWGCGLDRSFGACEVARDNLSRVGLGGRAAVVQGHWGDALSARRFDVVVSNPPYVRRATLPDLEPEVRDHDPRLSLDGGEDGLAAYRNIAGPVARLLRPGGCVAVEVGAGQAPEVAALFVRAGLRDPAFSADLAGIARVVVLSQGGVEAA